MNRIYGMSFLTAALLLAALSTSLIYLSIQNNETMLSDMFYHRTVLFSSLAPFTSQLSTKQSKQATL